MAVSPDGETVVTGGGDETVRLWNVFSKAFPEKVNAQFVHWGEKYVYWITFLR
jgi:WD40 repeat protein